MAERDTYDHCVDSVTEDQKESLNLSCLSLAYNGAEPVRAATLDRFAAAFAACGFDRKAFFPCYGMAETTLFTSGGPPLRDPALLRVSAAELESQIIAIADDCRETRTLVGCGRVGLDTRVVAVEPTSHRKLPADQIGEIWIDGGSVAKGYWNRAAESEETFCAMTADGDGPFLRTGDLGLLHDGQVYVTGRLKDLIIIRGRNIYPQDVEVVIEETTGFVKPNCCAAFSIEYGGVEGLAVALEANRELAREARSAAKDGEPTVNGHNRHGNQTTDGRIAQVISRLRESIAERFDILPVRITLLSPGTFPRTSSGKVQRRACKEGLQNGSLTVIYQWTSPLATARSVCAAEPQVECCETESQLACRLIEIINRWIPSQPQIAARCVAADSSLKSLGLDSLAINLLALEIESNLCVRLAPDILYECDTVFAIVCYLATKRPLVAGALTEQPMAESFDHRAGSHATNGVLHANGKSATNGYAQCNMELLDSVQRSGRAIDSLPATPVALPSASSVSAVEHKFALRNQRQRNWRRSGDYFFGTEIESQAGSWVQVGGRKMLMLASYNYLGLIGHDSVNQAAIDAIQKSGTGAHGARLIAGTLTEHLELERELAQFMRSEDAIVYNSGFLTNAATIAALVGEGDLVIGDELSHASIVDGCRLSRAEFKTFRHNDVRHLNQLLAALDASVKLVVVDAVYSMEGDLAKIPDIVETCKKHNALLMVDEAHSLGVLGATGRGVQDHFHLPDDAIDIKMGTLSKAIASCGGFVAASSDVVDFLKHQARGFIFSGALSAPQVAAARACLQLLESQPQRVESLRNNAQRLTRGLRQLGFRVAPTESAIVPILFDDEETTLRTVKLCREAGVFVVPVFYPAVPMNAPRIRATVMASHTDADIDFALAAFEKAQQNMPKLDATREVASLV